MPLLGEKLRVLGLLERAERQARAARLRTGSVQTPWTGLCRATPSSAKYTAVGRASSTRRSSRRPNATWPSRSWAAARWPVRRSEHASSAEIETLARVRHPNIVAIHDSGTVLGHPYLVMDFIAGQALDEYLAGRGSAQSGAGNPPAIPQDL